MAARHPRLPPTSAPPPPRSLHLLWDRGSIDRRREVRTFPANHPRLHVHYRRAADMLRARPFEAELRWPPEFNPERRMFMLRHLERLPYILMGSVLVDGVRVFKGDLILRLC